MDRDLLDRCFWWRNPVCTQTVNYKDMSFSHLINSSKLRTEEEWKKNHFLNECNLKQVVGRSADLNNSVMSQKSIRFYNEIPEETFVRASNSFVRSCKKNLEMLLFSPHVLLEIHYVLNVYTYDLRTYLCVCAVGEAQWIDGWLDFQLSLWVHLSV